MFFLRLEFAVGARSRAQILECERDAELVHDLHQHLVVDLPMNAFGGRLHVLHEKLLLDWLEVENAQEQVRVALDHVGDDLLELFFGNRLLLGRLLLDQFAALACCCFAGHVIFVVVLFFLVVDHLQHHVVQCALLQLVLLSASGSYRWLLVSSSALLLLMCFGLGACQTGAQVANAGVLTGRCGARAAYCARRVVFLECFLLTWLAIVVVVAHSGSSGIVLVVAGSFLPPGISCRFGVALRGKVGTTLAALEEGEFALVRELVDFDELFDRLLLGQRFDAELAQVVFEHGRVHGRVVGHRCQVHIRKQRWR